MGNRVLVIDDSVTFRTIIAATLEQAGRDVATACDGREALNLLNGDIFNLFIVDINMPRMNGVQFVVEMRKRPRFAKVPVLMLAAEDEVAEHPELGTAGHIHWLEKGFDPSELVQNVSEILE